MLDIVIAQINPVVGDVDYNLKLISNLTLSLSAEKRELVIFSECVLSGYPTGDLLTYETFIDRIQVGLNELLVFSKTVPNKLIAFGLPLREDNCLFNSLVVIENGEIVFKQHKTLLPNYDVFDEKRYFESNKIFSVFNCYGILIGFTICEDMWSNQVLGQDPYDIYPVKQLVDEGIDLLINVSASPFESEKYVKRLKIFSKQAQFFNIPMVVVNQVGANDQLIFDGGSFILNKKGKVVYQVEQFEKSFTSVNLHDVLNEKGLSLIDIKTDEVEQIFKALLLGIQDYVHKTGFKDVVIGLSGGIDSAVVCALATLALGAKHVRGVSLPSVFSSQGSLDDAEQLAHNCGIKYSVIPINSIYTQFLHDLEPEFFGKSVDVTEENLQARIRGNLLMSLSNKFNSLLLTTGNKSELAMGYCTLYGDMCGALSVLADVPKTIVYQLAHFINKMHELIPYNSIIKPPSAELRPGQKDSDSLPPYEVLDDILYLFIEQSASVSEIVKAGYDEQLVNDIVTKTNLNEYKRQQAAIPLKVTSKSFGHGRRMPIAARYKL